MTANADISLRVAAGEVGVERSFEAIATEWDELCDRLESPPFLRPGWLAAWWAAFGSGELQLVAVRRDGRLAGVLPLARRRGVMRGLANYHSPGFGAVAQDPEATRVLCEAAYSRTWRRLSLGLVDRADALPAEAEAGARAAGWRVLTRTMMRTPEVLVEGDWDSYVSGLGRGFRKELRRQRRRLGESGATQLEVSDGADRLAELLDEIFAVEASGWKGESGTAISSRPETRRFYEELATWASERGMLRLFLLRLEGRAIAVDYALEANGIRYMLKGGFDPEHSNLAPGTLLLEAGLKNAFETGLERVELGGDDDAYKLRWTSAIHERDLVQAFPRNPLGQVDWLAFAVGRPTAKRVLGRRAEGRARFG